MTKSEMYRAMAAYIRKHGFHPSFRSPKDRDCGCFMHAAAYVSPDAYEDFLNGEPVLSELMDIVGGSFGTIMLLDRGWRQDATLDAAAACEIAADLCEPSCGEPSV